MIYRNPVYGNDHNLVAPTASPFTTAPYDLVGRFNGFTPGVPIGPRLVVTARHAKPSVGAQFEVQDVTLNVQEVIDAPSGADVAFCILDDEVPEYAEIYRGESWNTGMWVFGVGGGLGRGTEIRDSGGTLIGYNVGDYTTFAWRWGGTHPSFFTFSPPPGATPNMGCKFHNDTTETVYCGPGDSGGGAFINSGTAGAWRYLGPIVSATGSQAMFYTEDNNWHGMIVALLTYDLDFIDELNADPPDPIPQPPEPPTPPTEFPTPPTRPLPEVVSPTRGDIIYHPSFQGSDLPDSIAKTGGTAMFEVSDGLIEVSGGAGSFDSNLIECVDCYSADEQWAIEVELYSPVMQPSDTSGAFIGLKAQAAGVVSSVWGGVGFDAENNGRLMLYAPSSARGVAESKTGLGLIGSENQIRMTLRRTRGVVTLTALNRNTNRMATISFRYPEIANNSLGTPTIYPASTGRPAIGTSGGSWSVKSLRFTSYTHKYPPVVVVGDDIACGLTRGLFGVGSNMRFADVMQDTFGAPVAVFAGGGDTAALGELRIDEVIAMEPQAAVIQFGLNDITRAGTSAGSVITSLSAIVAALEAHQIKCRVLTGFPNNYPTAANASTMLALRDAIIAAFPTKHIDTYPLFNDGSGGMSDELCDDGIHPNQAGHYLLGQYVSGGL